MWPVVWYRECSIYVLQHMWTVLGYESFCMVCGLLYGIWLLNGMWAVVWYVGCWIYGLLYGMWYVA